MLEEMNRLRRATLSARAVNPSLSTGVEAGKIFVVEVHYRPSGVSDINYLTGGLAVDDAIAYLNKIAAQF